MAKAPDSGTEGSLFKSRYDLVKDHLPVKLTGANITFAIVMYK